MRILHLNDEPWDSGLTQYSLQIAELLKKAGHEIVFGARPGKKPFKAATKMELETRPVENPLDVRHLMAQEKWDVINVHTGRTHSWAVLCQKTMSNKNRVPILRTRGDAKSLKVNFLAKYIYGQTKGVIAASDHIRKQYEEGFGFGEDKVRTIYPSVELSAEITLPPKMRVGILGRLDAVKGHTYFLEAAAHVLKQIRHVEFFIGGREAGLSFNLLANHARQLGIENSVQLLGYRPSVEEFMKSCTVGVISSIGSEEVSRVCLEWMANARPVVGTLVGCLPELIEPQETGLLVTPGDAMALGDAILEILQDSDTAEKWGHASYELAKRRFSPSLQLQQTVDLYKAVLNQ